MRLQVAGYRPQRKRVAASSTRGSVLERAPFDDYKPAGRREDGAQRSHEVLAPRRLDRLEDVAPDTHACRLGAQGCRLGAQGCRLDAQGCRLDAQGCRLVAQGCRLDALDAQGCRLDAQVAGWMHRVAGWVHRAAGSTGSKATHMKMRSAFAPSGSAGAARGSIRMGCTLAAVRLRAWRVRRASERTSSGKMRPDGSSDANSSAKRPAPVSQ